MDHLTISKTSMVETYISKGLSVIPLKVKDKRPLGSWKEYQSQRVTKQEFEELVKGMTDYNVGIVTGKVSNLTVLDIDGEKGKENLSALGIDYKEHPHVISGNGLHIYFRYHESISNKTGMLEGLDIRSDGGYIVAPPSIHPNGSTYSWGSILELEDIQSMPDSLLNLIQNKTLPEAYVNKSIESELQILHLAAKGRRNDILNKTVFNLSTLEKDTSKWEGRVYQAALSIGLPPEEIEQTLNSAKGAGLKIERPPLKDTPKTANTHIQWKKDPEPLGNLLVDVPTLSKEQLKNMLPGPLYEWVADNAERLEVPYEFMANPAILMLSGAIGNRLSIQPKKNDYGWTEIPNLWGINVASPSAKKSPVLSACLSPLEKVEKKWMEEFLEKELARKTEIDILSQKKKGLQKVLNQVSFEEPSEYQKAIPELEKVNQELAELQNVKPKRVMSSNATEEALAVLMKDNSFGILLKEDEMSRLFSSFYKKGHETSRSFLLSSWSGKESYSVDRVGRGHTYVPNCTVSLTGNIQPHVLMAFVESQLSKVSSGDDGLLNRFAMFVWPDFGEPKNTIDRVPNKEAQNTIESIVSRICNLEERTTLKFIPESQKLFDSWLEGNKKKAYEYKLQGNHSMEAHLSKYPSLLSSLAVIFETVDCIHFNKHHLSLVSERSIKMALEWVKILEGHAKRLYQTATYPDRQAAHLLAEKIDCKVLMDGVDVRTINKSGWSGLNNSKNIKSGLAYLEKKGWLKVLKCQTDGGGRPSYKVYFHPKIQPN